MFFNQRPSRTSYSTVPFAGTDLSTEEVPQVGVGGEGSDQSDAVLHRGTRTAVALWQSAADMTGRWILW